jgi:hypothetical protein
MKALSLTRTIQYIVALLAVSLLYAPTLTAQTEKKHKKTEKAAVVTRMIEAQNYVFKPQTAHPMRGRVMQLTSEYTVKVGKDTIISDLPYFGRAYTAPIDPAKGGIQFTSTKFEYKVDTLKKGWQVTIKPTDVGDVQQLFLTVFNNGTATLQVTNTNRQPISFNGYVIEKK